MTKEQAEQAAKTVKERYPHTSCVVKHEPLGSYPDRHVVLVYADKLTGDQDKDEAIPHFTLIGDAELDWFTDMLRVLFPIREFATLKREYIQYLAWLLSPDFEMERGTGKFSEVEEDTLYTRPVTYGERRYHMTTLSYGHGLILEQTDHGEKYQQRVTLEAGEYNPFLRQLLIWWLNKVKPGQDNMARADQIEDNPFS